MKRVFVSIVLIATVAATNPRSEVLAADSRPSHRFAIGTHDFLLDGQRLQIRCGEIHAPRVAKEYWRHRLQMAKAMGLNTVCAYLFWNMHEPRPGEFTWSGQADAAGFCRIAQEEGLWVILRPGPYSCAEWEMGGFPSWLLKDDIKLRTRDPSYLDAVKRYLREVGRLLGPLQVTKGGPILMVQVENEYGFYGNDSAYMGDLRQMLLDSGFNVPLFACNPKDHLKDGWRADLFPVVNFGSDPEGGFRALRRVLPTGPLMCGEFYPGWFDTWGAPHHLGATDSYLRDLEYMLKVGGSFSIYMAHGGTSFGFWSGADRPFKPDTSSYDYDAPISEAGWPTEKFFKTRALLKKYLLPGESIADLPAPHRLIRIGPVEVKEFASISANLPVPRTDEKPRNFEYYDQRFGCIQYRTRIPAGPAATLKAAAVHDIGQVYVDGKRIGFMDRRSRAFSITLGERKAEAVLDILVEAMGRVNFGPEVHDRKGMQGPVTLAGKELTGWQVFNLPFDEKMLKGLKYERAKPNGPAFYRAKASVSKPGDCFLDMRPWGKGFAWVNGHNLGRYWNIGPQQTMYVPGPWLKAGENEIVVLDLLGPETPVLAALDKPILNLLRPELDFARIGKRRPAMEVDSPQPVFRGAFAAGTALQAVRFASAAQGRYFAIESRSAHDGKPYAAIAELALIGADGKPLSTAGWTIAGVDSEETDREDGSASNAMDGQTATFWHTEWGSASPDHPHILVLDLGRTETIAGFQYTPRQGDAGVGGRIKDYTIYIGNKLKPRVAPKPRAAIRVTGPDTMAAGNVYLLRVETQLEPGKPWKYVEPDEYSVTVSGAGRLLKDPALKPMNPFTVDVPPSASGEVKVQLQCSAGASFERVFQLGTGESITVVFPMWADGTRSVPATFLGTVIDSPVLGASAPAGRFAAEINPRSAAHRFAGLGGGVLFYDNQFDITQTQDIYDWCFADVKASILHLLIRPDCEPAIDEGDWRTLDRTKFDFKSAARPLRIAREALKRNPGMKIYASLYTPPAWMKSNGSTRGDGTLKDGVQFRRALAKYVFAWLKNAQEAGIAVDYLAFFNEPDWPHTQDGMHFENLGLLADAFSDCAVALDALIAADGTFKTRPLLVFPDSLGPGSITRGGRNSEGLRSRAGRLARVDVWGVHDYWNTSGDYWENRYRELRAFPGVGDKPIWMTEWAQRDRHGDLESALEYGRNILNSIRLGAEAWMVFEWCHPYGNQSGLISTDWGEQTGQRRYWRSKAYHIFRQIANTTPAGSHVVVMKKAAGGAPLEYLAIMSGKRLIVHLLNSSSSPVNCSLEASGPAVRRMESWSTTPFVEFGKMPRTAFTLRSVGDKTVFSGDVPAYSLVTLVAEQ